MLHLRRRLSTSFGSLVGLETSECLPATDIAAVHSAWLAVLSDEEVMGHLLADDTLFELVKAQVARTARFVLAAEAVGRLPFGVALPHSDVDKMLEIGAYGAMLPVAALDRLRVILDGVDSPRARRLHDVLRALDAHSRQMQGSIRRLSDGDEVLPQFSATLQLLVGLRVALQTMSSTLESASGRDGAIVSTAAQGLLQELQSSQVYKDANLPVGDESPIELQTLIFGTFASPELSHV